MRDVVVLGVMLLSFALFATAHVTIVVGLTRRPPRWRAFVALLVAPLAPYWALREKMRVRAVLWIVSAVAYAVTRLVG